MGNVALTGSYKRLWEQQPTWRNNNNRDNFYKEIRNKDGTKDTKIDKNKKVKNDDYKKYKRIGHVSLLFMLLFSYFILTIGLSGLCLK